MHCRSICSTWSPRWKPAPGNASAGGAVIPESASFGRRRAVPGVIDLGRSEIKALGLNGFGLFQRHGAFDHVLKLSDIAGPGVSLQGSSGAC